MRVKSHALCASGDTFREEWHVGPWDSDWKGKTHSQYRSHLLICWWPWWNEKLLEDKTHMPMNQFLSEWVHISVLINHWHQNQHVQPFNMDLIPGVHKGTCRPLAPVQAAEVSSFLDWEPGSMLLWHADSFIILSRFCAVSQFNVSPFILHIYGLLIDFVALENP